MLSDNTTFKKVESCVRNDTVYKKNQKQSPADFIQTGFVVNTHKTL